MLKGEWVALASAVGLKKRMLCIFIHKQDPMFDLNLKDYQGKDLVRLARIRNADKIVTYKVANVGSEGAYVWFEIFVANIAFLLFCWEFVVFILNLNFVYFISAVKLRRTK